MHSQSSLKLFKFGTDKELKEILEKVLEAPNTQLILSNTILKSFGQLIKFTTKH